MNFEEKKMINEQQIKELETKARELMAWLQANGHPHMTIIITQAYAELSEGVVGIQCGLSEVKP